MHVSYCDRWGSGLVHLAGIWRGSDCVPAGFWVLAGAVFHNDCTQQPSAAFVHNVLRGDSAFVGNVVRNDSALVHNGVNNDSALVRDDSALVGNDCQ